MSNKNKNKQKHFSLPVCEICNHFLARIASLSSFDSSELKRLKLKETFLSRRFIGTLCNIVEIQLKRQHLCVAQSYQEICLQECQAHICLKAKGQTPVSILGKIIKGRSENTQGQIRKKQDLACFAFQAGL